MRPRHYILIALIVALGIFNFIRARCPRAPQNSEAVVVSSGPAPQSAAWTAFDKAAALREAPEANFAPALQSLQQAEQAAPESDNTVAEVKGCQTWLMFYRQGVMHPSKDASWRDRSTKHLDDCVKTHHDAG